MSPSLTLTVLDHELTVARMSPSAPVSSKLLQSPFFAITRTEEELSIVCRSADVPPEAVAEAGWSAFKVAGPLSFSMTGVLASLTAPLAEAKVSIFALSTFDTDYVLVKRLDLEKAIGALSVAGHMVVEA